MNDVQIVTIDGPTKLNMWLCRECQKDLGPEWFITEAKPLPSPQPCDRRGFGTCKGDSE